MGRFRTGSFSLGDVKEQPSGLLGRTTEYATSSWNTAFSNNCGHNSKTEASRIQVDESTNYVWWGARPWKVVNNSGSTVGKDMYVMYCSLLLLYYIILYYYPTRQSKLVLLYGMNGWIIALGRWSGRCRPRWYRHHCCCVALVSVCCCCCCSST